MQENFQFLYTKDRVVTASHIKHSFLGQTALWPWNKLLLSSGFDILPTTLSSDDNSIPWTQSISKIHLDSIVLSDVQPSFLIPLCSLLPQLQPSHLTGFPTSCPFDTFVSVLSFAMTLPSDILCWLHLMKFQTVFFKRHCHWHRHRLIYIHIHLQVHLHRCTCVEMTPQTNSPTLPGGPNWSCYLLTPQFLSLSQHFLPYFLL